jgi:hypothetical protein
MFPGRRRAGGVPRFSHPDDGLQTMEPEGAVASAAVSFGGVAKRRYRISNSALSCFRLLSKKIFSPRSNRTSTN